MVVKYYGSSSKTLRFSAPQLFQHGRVLCLLLEFRATRLSCTSKEAISGDVLLIFLSESLKAERAWTKPARNLGTRVCLVKCLAKYAPSNFRMAEFISYHWQQNRYSPQILFEPEVLQTQCRADLGWILYFGLANFRKLAGKFLSEFWWKVFPAIFSALFFQSLWPTKQIAPKIHAQTCRHSYAISLSRTQRFFTAIFCLWGRPIFWGSYVWITVTVLATPRISWSHSIPSSWIVVANYSYSS